MTSKRKSPDPDTVHPIQVAPDDVLGVILRLTNRATQISCLRVCKRWRRVISPVPIPASWLTEVCCYCNDKVVAATRLVNCCYRSRHYDCRDPKHKEIESDVLWIKNSAWGSSEDTWPWPELCSCEQADYAAHPSTLDILWFITSVYSGEAHLAHKAMLPHQRKKMLKCHGTNMIRGAIRTGITANELLDLEILQWCNVWESDDMYLILGEIAARNRIDLLSLLLVCNDADIWDDTDPWMAVHGSTWILALAATQCARNNRADMLEWIWKQIVRNGTRWGVTIATVLSVLHDTRGDPHDPVYLDEWIHMPTAPARRAFLALHMPPVSPPTTT